MRAIWLFAAVVFGALALLDGGISGFFLVFALYMSVYYLDDIASSLRKLTRDLEQADKPPEDTNKPPKVKPWS